MFKVLIEQSETHFNDDVEMDSLFLSEEQEKTLSSSDSSQVRENLQQSASICPTNTQCQSNLSLNNRKCKNIPLTGRVRGERLT